MLRQDENGFICPETASLARAHYTDSGQSSETWVLSDEGERGFIYLCDGMAGGPQGSPFTNLFFPLAIDSALKDTEAKYPGVEVKAIQDDIDLSGDPAVILGPDGALQYLLTALAACDLKPNHSKFQAITTDREAWTAAGPPSWLECGYIITDPALKTEVDLADALAKAALIEAENAPPADKIEADRAALALVEKAKAARLAVPEDKKAYGAISCGTAIGDDAFISDYLDGVQRSLCGDPTTGTPGIIAKTSTTLAQDSTHAASAAIHYSLQQRIDYILGTHLPSETRQLAAAVDAALRKAYHKSFGFDVLGDEGAFQGQEDPTFIRDLAGLKTKFGGCGFRRTTIRAPFMGVMANIIPQFSVLWPSLTSITGGADRFSKENKITAWATFFASGGEHAVAFKDEIERVKSLYASALAASGLADKPPENELFQSPTEGFGAGVEKLHHKAFEQIGILQAKALRVRAAALRSDDQRKLAFEQSSECPFSNTLFTNTPSRWLRFTNLEFQVSVQRKLGAPVTCLKPIIGCLLQTSSAGPASKVEAFGNNITKLKGANGGGTTQNHNSFVDALSYWLSARARIPLQGGKYGKPSTCKGIFSGLTGLLQQALHGSIGEVPEKHRKSLQKIIPDLLIDGRYLKQNLAGMGFDALAAIKTMVDVKTLSCCDKYAACHVTSVAAVVNKRQAEASAAYRTKARELDHLLIAKQVVAVPPLGTPGPYESVLNSFGKVLAPVVGAFAEMSSDVHLLADLIASAQAADHCEYFDTLPSEIKGMFLLRTRRNLGLTAHRGWARLLIDRMGTLVQRPEPEAPEPAWGSTKASVQDDEAMDAHHFHHPPPLRLQHRFRALRGRAISDCPLCRLKPDPPPGAGGLRKNILESVLEFCPSLQVNRILRGYHRRPPWHNGTSTDWPRDFGFRSGWSILSLVSVHRPPSGLRTRFQAQTASESPLGQRGDLGAQNTKNGCAH